MRFLAVVVLFIQGVSAGAQNSNDLEWVNGADFTSVIISNWPENRRNPLLEALGNRHSENSETKWLDKSQARMIVSALKQLKALDLVVVEEGSVCPEAVKQARENHTDELGSGLYHKVCPVGVMTKADYERHYPKRGHDLVGRTCYLNNDQQKPINCELRNAVDFLSLTRKYDPATGKWVLKGDNLQARQTWVEDLIKRSKYASPEVLSAYVSARLAESDPPGGPGATPTTVVPDASR
jgi:hypothetical protein